MSFSLSIRPFDPCLVFLSFFLSYSLLINCFFLFFSFKRKRTDVLTPISQSTDTEHREHGPRRRARTRAWTETSRRTRRSARGQSARRFSTVGEASSKRYNSKVGEVADLKKTHRRFHPQGFQTLTRGAPQPVFQTGRPALN